MDMARYVPSQQVGNVEDDYLTPSPDVPYYINLAITGHGGIILFLFALHELSSFKHASCAPHENFS